MKNSFVIIKLMVAIMLVAAMTQGCATHNSTYSKRGLVKHGCRGPKVIPHRR